MARPRKEINQDEFESLCVIQCTLPEITAYFDHKLRGCSEDTIERWCKRTYGKGFAEISTVKREYGKISLRRNQWRLAEKNAAMAIFLGKNILGQSDTVKVESKADGKLADLIDGLREDNDLHTEAEGVDAPVADE